MSKRPAIREHPALTSAKHAIRRNVSRLTPIQVFHVASLTEILRFGEDAAHFDWVAKNAETLPPYHWTCDEPRITKEGGR